ncbi:MAG: hypothetical protein WKG06_23060 [Segetibacter sp.]
MAIAKINVSLSNSLNKVRVVAHTSNGGPNLDKMEVAPDNSLFIVLK